MYKNWQASWKFLVSNFYRNSLISEIDDSVPPENISNSPGFLIYSGGIFEISLLPQMLPSEKTIAKERLTWKHRKRVLEVLN